MSESQIAGSDDLHPKTEADPLIDRTISPISGRLGGAMAGKAITMAALVAGCAVFVFATWRHAPPKARVPLEPAAQVVAFEPAKTAASSALSTPPTLEHPGPDVPALDGAPGSGGAGAAPASQAGKGADGANARMSAEAQSAAEAKAAQIQAIRAAPILAFSQGETGAGLVVAEAVRPVDAPASPPSELDQLRRGSTIGLARASRLPDRNFLIAAGTSIPCTLQTAMDTATPGYVTCLVGQDVYSDNGAVVLMEKGAKVLGEYRSGMRQGQRRLFVLWTRAATPAGVAIGLASPASDALGRAGFDGQIDSHFWERFGGALLLSIVDDTSAAIASRNDPNGTVTRVPSDAAGIALQNSINIPPSLTKPQGAQVAIFVAQDLDFSSVYGLKAR
jgi:type IV secretion system protein VirB10